MSLDFSNAQLPRLLPLENSYTENEVEADLKQLFLDLFNDHLAADTFDVNVLGAAHLGSFDLVRKAVNADGLVLMQGDREEAATRYLYRAWKSGDVQGRGLHFLRTYLQMLFPNLCQVDQLWHDKAMPYPTGLYPSTPRFSWWLHQIGEPGLKLDGTWGVGRRILNADESRADRPIDTDQMYLTSRVEIVLDFSVNVRSIASLMHIIRSVIPARLLPVFRFWLNFVLYVEILASSSLLMQKNSRMRYPWCGRVIGDSTDVRWKLGKDGALVKLPQPFGSFRLGETRGGKSVWHLKGCRIQSTALMESKASALIYRLPKLGETDRRVDGTWRLGGRSLYVGSHAAMQKRIEMAAPAGLVTTFHDKHQIKYPATPARLGSVARLAPWRRLDGRWRVGEKSVRRPFGFAIERDEAFLAEGALGMSSTASAWAIPEKLARPAATKLKGTARKLNGAWFLGAENRIGHFPLDGRRLRAMKMTQYPRIGHFTVAADIPGDVEYASGEVRRLRLDGAWRVGGPAAPEFKLEVFKVPGGPGYEPAPLDDLDDSVLPVGLADWNHVVVYGQSLSVGATARPPLSTTPRYGHLTFGAGPRASKAGSLGANPGTDTVKGLIENTAASEGSNRGETPCSGLAHAFTELSLSEDGIAPGSAVLFCSAPGHGGYSLAQLDMRSAWAQVLKDHVTEAKARADEAGKSYQVVAMPWMQGEANSGTAYQTYYDGMVRLQAEFSEWVKGITGQTFDVPIIMYQTPNNGSQDGQISRAQLDLCLNEPGFFFGGPIYHMEPATDGTHITNVSEYRTGHQFGRAVKQYLIDRKKPAFIRSLGAVRKGNTIEWAFSVPQRPLVFDVATMPQTTDYGFRVNDSAGNKLAISSIDIRDGDTVVITLAAGAATAAQVRYALDYRAAGTAWNDEETGNLRDSARGEFYVGTGTYRRWHVAPSCRAAITQG